MNKNKFLLIATVVIVAAGLLGFIGSQIMKPGDGPSQMISDSTKPAPSATSTDVPKVPGGKLVEPSKQDFSEDIADTTIPLEQRQALALELIVCPVGTERINNGTFNIDITGSKTPNTYLIVSCATREKIQSAVYTWADTKWNESISLNSDWRALYPVKTIKTKTGTAIVGVDSNKHIVAAIIAPDGTVSLTDKFNPNL